MAVERPRGTRDFTPEEMWKRHYVESVLRRVAEKFNYGEVMFPLFEHTQLFQLKSGEEIAGHMYVFEDKGGRSLCLRPEATASVARMFGTSLRNLQKPIRVYYFAPMYRYEEPQKNRYREFWQFGVELIGAGTREGDVEAVILAVECLRKLGVKHTLEIGHLGVMRSLLDDFGLNEELQNHAIACLDRKNYNELKKVVREKALFDLIELNGGIEVLGKAEGILSSHEKALKSLGELGDIVKLLDLANVKYTLNFGMARGLAYYTGIIFEVRVPGLGAQNQICGGGRYDNLVKLFSGLEEPAVGFAFGFDRLLDAMESQGISVPEQERAVVVAPVVEEVRKMAFEISARLRSESKHTVEFDIMNRRLGKVLEYAAKIKAKHVVIVGLKELRENKVVVRDMDSGEQKEVRLDELSSFLGGSHSSGPQIFP
ncbi:MAG: histidine--tRNA ligase [Candidatus Altiarchaeota archaeon]